MVDYPETIEVYDIKVGINSKLNEYRAIYVYQTEVKIILWPLFKVTHISLISNIFCPEAI